MRALGTEDAQLGFGILGFSGCGLALRRDGAPLTLWTRDNCQNLALAVRRWRSARRAADEQQRHGHHGHKCQPNLALAARAQAARRTACC